MDAEHTENPPDILIWEITECRYQPEDMVIPEHWMWWEISDEDDNETEDGAEDS